VLTGSLALLADAGHKFVKEGLDMIAQFPEVAKFG
jgi:Co/Zn/Cd efflux system component